MIHSRPPIQPMPSHRPRHATTLAALAVLAAGLGACGGSSSPITYAVEGWWVICGEIGEYEDHLPDTVCLWKLIEGGAYSENFAAACAQEHNKYYGDNKTPADFADAYIWEIDGSKRTCLTEDVGDLEAHNFPVTVIEDVDPSTFNFVWCHPDKEIEIIADGGSSKVYVSGGKCLAPGEIPEEACEDHCESWRSQYPEYDEFNDDEDHGDCGTDNWSTQLAYHDDCGASLVPGLILAASATMSFGDTLNAITVPGEGALIYDDSACATGTACEPGLVFKVEAATATYVYTDATGATYDVALTNLSLGTPRRVQTQLDATSGGLVLPEVELSFSADDLMVEGVSFGALDGREFMHWATVTTDPTNGALVVGGSIELPALGGAQLSLVVQTEPGAMLAEWPWTPG